MALFFFLGIICGAHKQYDNNWKAPTAVDFPKSVNYVTLFKSCVTFTRLNIPYFVLIL